MCTKKMISTHSCLFAVCFVIYILIIPVHVYAGGKAQCPCFSAADLINYAPSRGSVTHHLNLCTERLPYPSNECLTYGSYQILRMNYWDESMCGPNEECPGTLYIFGASVDVDGVLSCSGVFLSMEEVEGWVCDKGEGDTLYTCHSGELLNLKDYNACVDLLQRAEDADRSAYVGR